MVMRGEAFYRFEWYLLLTVIVAMRDLEARGLPWSVDRQTRVDYPPGRIAGRRSKSIVSQ